MMSEPTKEMDYADFKILAEEASIGQESDGQEVNDTDMSTSPHGESTGQIIKRKRGRPKLSDSKRKKVQQVEGGDSMEKNGENFINALSLKSGHDTGQVYKRPRGRPKMSELIKKKYQSTGRVRGRPRIYNPMVNFPKRPRGRPRVYTGNVSRSATIPSSMQIHKNNSLVKKSPKWHIALCEDTEDQDPDVTIQRLTGRHFPYRLSPANICHVCRGNGLQQRTDVYCKECAGAPPLCAVPCFRIYHTTFRYIAQTDNSFPNDAPVDSSLFIKRPRGRPKREKQRGRPRKVDKANSVGNKDRVSNETESAKKQRGRPRTINTPNYTENSSDSGNEREAKTKDKVNEENKQEKERPKRMTVVIPNLYAENSSESDEEFDKVIEDYNKEPYRNSMTTANSYIDYSSDDYIEREGETSKENITEAAKRPRGRPKKEKKSRGRPKKEYSDDLIHEHMTSAL